MSNVESIQLDRPLSTIEALDSNLVTRLSDELEITTCQQFLALVLTKTDFDKSQVQAFVSDFNFRTEVLGKAEELHQLGTVIWDFGLENFAEVQQIIEQVEAAIFETTKIEPDFSQMPPGEDMPSL